MSETNNKQKKIKFEALMYIICGCILSMGAIHMDTINWILPQVATDLASGHSTLMVTSGFFYGMMIGHVVVGPLSDMIGKKKTMILGFVVCILGAIVGGTSGSLGGLIVARLIQGIGGAASSNAARAIGGDAGKGKKSYIHADLVRCTSNYPSVKRKMGRKCNGMAGNLLVTGNHLWYPLCSCITLCC